MKLPRRKFLRLAVGAAALPVVSRLARAQTYPSRPVRIIVGFPAGGSGDLHARLNAAYVNKALANPEPSTHGTSRRSMPRIDTSGRRSRHALDILHST